VNNSQGENDDYENSFEGWYAGGKEEENILPESREEDDGGLVKGKRETDQGTP